MATLPWLPGGLTESIHTRLLGFVKAALLRQLVPPESMVCDLFCGRGLDTERWASAGIGRYVGVDLSASALEQAREQWEHHGRPFPAEFCELDPCMVDLEAHLLGQGPPADVVCCLAHLQDSFISDEMVKRLLKNVEAVLKPGGYFFGIVPDSSTIWYKYQKAVEGAMKAGSLRMNGTLPNVRTELYKISFDDDRFHAFGSKYHMRFTDDGLPAQPQLLVHFPSLIRLARDVGLECVEIQNLGEFYDDYSGQFSDLVKTCCGSLVDNKDGKDRLNSQAMDVLSLYTTFIFKRADLDMVNEHPAPLLEQASDSASQYLTTLPSQHFQTLSSSMKDARAWHKRHKVKAEGRNPLASANGIMNTVPPKQILQQDLDPSNHVTRVTDPAEALVVNHLGRHLDSGARGRFHEHAGGIDEVMDADVVGLDSHVDGQLQKSLEENTTKKYSKRLRVQMRVHEDSNVAAQHEVQLATQETEAISWPTREASSSGTTTTMSADRDGREDAQLPPLSTKAHRTPKGSRKPGPTAAAEGGRPSKMDWQSVEEALPADFISKEAPGITNEDFRKSERPASAEGRRVSVMYSKNVDEAPHADSNCKDSLRKTSEISRQSELLLDSRERKRVRTMDSNNADRASPAGFDLKDSPMRTNEQSTNPEQPALTDGRRAKTMDLKHVVGASGAGLDSKESPRRTDEIYRQSDQPASMERARASRMDSKAADEASLPGFDLKDSSTRTGEVSRKADRPVSTEGLRANEFAWRNADEALPAGSKDSLRTTIENPSNSEQPASMEGARGRRLHSENTSEALSAGFSVRDSSMGRNEISRKADRPDPTEGLKANRVDLKHLEGLSPAGSDLKDTLTIANDKSRESQLSGSTEGGRVSRMDVKTPEEVSRAGLSGKDSLRSTIEKSRKAKQPTVEGGWAGMVDSKTVAEALRTSFYSKDSMRMTNEKSRKSGPAAASEGGRMGVMDARNVDESSPASLKSKDSNRRTNEKSRKSGPAGSSEGGRLGSLDSRSAAVVAPASFNSKDTLRRSSEESRKLDPASLREGGRVSRIDSKHQEAAAPADINSKDALRRTDDKSKKSDPPISGGGTALGVLGAKNPDEASPAGCTSKDSLKRAQEKSRRLEPAALSDRGRVRTENREGASPADGSKVSLRRVNEKLSKFDAVASTGGERAGRMDSRNLQEASPAGFCSEDSLRATHEKFKTSEPGASADEGRAEEILSRTVLRNVEAVSPANFNTKNSLRRIDEQSKKSKPAASVDRGRASMMDSRHLAEPLPAGFDSKDSLRDTTENVAESNSGEMHLKRSLASPSPKHYVRRASDTFEGSSRSENYQDAAVRDHSAKHYLRRNVESREGGNKRKMPDDPPKHDFQTPHDILDESARDEKQEELPKPNVHRVHESADQSARHEKQQEPNKRDVQGVRETADRSARHEKRQELPKHVQRVHESADQSARHENWQELPKHDVQRVHESADQFARHDKQQEPLQAAVASKHYERRTHDRRDERSRTASQPETPALNSSKHYRRRAIESAIESNKREVDLVDKTGGDNGRPNWVSRSGSQQKPSRSSLLSHGGRSSQAARIRYPPNTRKPGPAVALGEENAKS